MNPLLILAKLDAIERCVARARDEYAAAGDGFASDFTRQDAAILNILRACEQAIDVANIMLREHQLGIPQSSRDSFTLLVDAGMIPDELGGRLRRMVGFRNTAIHEYQSIDVDIVQAVIQRGLDDLLELCHVLIRHTRNT